MYCFQCLHLFANVSASRYEFLIGIIICVWWMYDDERQFFYDFIDMWCTIWSYDLRFDCLQISNMLFSDGNLIHSKNLYLIQCEHLYMTITSIGINHFCHFFVRLHPQTEYINMVFGSFVNISRAYSFFSCCVFWLVKWNLLFVCICSQKRFCLQIWFFVWA